MSAASKYHSRKTTIDGIKFDSRSEAAYYLELKAMKQAHQIRDFELQQRFLLQEGFRKCPHCFHVQAKGAKCEVCQTKAVLYRPMSYVCDFVIWPYEGRPQVIDVKGKFMTQEFRLKQKLFEKRYPCLTIQIQVMTPPKAKRGGR